MSMRFQDRIGLWWRKHRHRGEPTKPKKSHEMAVLLKVTASSKQEAEQTLRRLLKRSKSVEVVRIEAELK